MDAWQRQRCEVKNGESAGQQGQRLRQWRQRRVPLLQQGPAVSQSSCQLELFPEYSRSQSGPELIVTPASRSRRRSDSVIEVQQAPASRSWDRLPVLMRAAEEEELIKITPWAPPQCRNSKDRVGEAIKGPVMGMTRQETSSSGKRMRGQMRRWHLTR